MGANLGDAPATLREALRLLDEHPAVTVEACSSAYASDPVGYVDQPPFVNAVARLRTSLEPAATLALLLATEDRLGRVRGVRFGPRTCDLDLLLHGATVSAEPESDASASAHARAAFRARAIARTRSRCGVAGRPHGRLTAGCDGLAGGSPALGHFSTLTTMSHVDDLEEFDAEAELRLKREYATVFGLFRYCVLTQEATYLCNRLNLEIEHQPSYPLIHLTMEDVWVWDKNRPTRIIPRADVHTTQDVTIEELRPIEEMPTTLPPDFAPPPASE